MNAHTRSIIQRFGTSIFAQAILGMNLQQISYLAKKYNITYPSKDVINADAAAIVAEQFKAV